MKPIIFNPNKFPKVAILIKETACNHVNVNAHYITADYCYLAYPLKYNPSNKAPAKFCKEYLEHLLPEIKAEQISILYVADATYFKFLTKKQKTENTYGYVFKCALPGYTDLDVIYGVNYQVLFHNPKAKDKLDLSLKTLQAHITGTPLELGKNIIHSAKYASTVEEVKKICKELHQYSALTCDIETTGLHLNNANILSIAFAWDQHNGVAISTRLHGVSEYVIDFLITYKGKLIFHNATFDIRNIIHRWFKRYNSWSTSIVDALDIMYRDVEDTKLIAYLCTNSTEGNQLSLKQLAYEFAGDYAQEDIKDPESIPTSELLEYNLTDCLCTWYVYNKFMPILKAENQEIVYKYLFKPSLKNITHMELVGMPMDYNTIKELENSLLQESNHYKAKLQDLPIIKEYEWRLKLEQAITANNKLKRKVRSIDEFNPKFNPNSNEQLAGLLFDQVGLPVLSKTNTGQPAVGKKVLNSLLQQIMNEHDLTEDDL